MLMCLLSLEVEQLCGERTRQTSDSAAGGTHPTRLTGVGARTSSAVVPRLVEQLLDNLGHRFCPETKSHTARNDDDDGGRLLQQTLKPDQPLAEQPIVG
jgi:hypothetical protein